MPKYLVATAEGGIMEKPDFTYVNVLVVEEPSEKEAKRWYRAALDEDYWGVAILATLSDTGLEVWNDCVTIAQIKMLEEN